MLTPFPAENPALHLLIWEENTAALVIIIQMEAGASILKQHSSAKYHPVSFQGYILNSKW